MNQRYKLTIQIEDTSYASLMGGLNEILSKLKQDDDQIELGKKLVYESSYVEDSHGGEYLAIIETVLPTKD